MQERVAKTQTKPAKVTKLTVKIDAALAARALAEEIDLASLLELALRANLERRGSAGLNEADRSAIEAHQRLEAEHGSWVDDWGKY